LLKPLQGMSTAGGGRDMRYPSGLARQTVAPAAIRDIQVIVTVLGGRAIPTESTRRPPQ
jgi:hypothetical protein